MTLEDYQRELRSCAQQPFPRVASATLMTNAAFDSELGEDKFRVLEIEFKQRRAAGEL